MGLSIMYRERKSKKSDSLMQIKLPDYQIKELNKRTEKLEHLNLVLQAIRNVNQLIIKEKDRNKLLEGVGISKENLTKLFEPLFTTKAKDIGLGLAVSKILIEGFNGRIEVQSKVGKGSTFTIKLPIHKKEDH